jgi:hypothetical protein
MRWIETAVLGVFLAAAPLTASPGQQPRADALEIKELQDSFELSVPVSRLIMTMPKGNLSRKNLGAGGATNNPRYFSFVDSTSGLIISGWFEPEESYRGAEKLWKSETEAWKRRGDPSPQNVSFMKAGDWDVIAYEMQMSIAGSNSHLRAERAEKGTWIDVHMSLTSDRTSAEARARLLEVLNQIQVKEKAESGPPPPANGVAIVEAGETYEVSYPASKLILVIPKGDLAPEKLPSDKAEPQFFYLTGSEIMAYGYFRPAKSFPGVERVWENEIKVLKAGGFEKVPTNVSFKKVGNWETVNYDLEAPVPGMSLPGIRGGWVFGETWIDLTLRILSKRPVEEARAKLEDLLKTIEVRPAQ